MGLGKGLEIWLKILTGAKLCRVLNKSMEFEFYLKCDRKALRSDHLNLAGMREKSRSEVR